VKTIIFAVRDDQDLNQVLSSLEDWSYEDLGIPGSFKKCLRKDGTTVAIRPISTTSCATSNILPHDSSGDTEAADMAIKQLGEALDAAGINYGIHEQVAGV
jgi:hypothetical protein